MGGDVKGPVGLGRRFAQALEMTEPRHQAVLLLHDVDGLTPPELATAFGLTEEGARALLFRAREEYRRVFEELSSGPRAATCRLAEQTAAGAVGRGLSAREARRLEAHAGYCKPCRLTMKGWGAGAVGLGSFLADAPLPKALETAPVFGTAIAITKASSADAGAGSVARALAWAGRLVRSRGAAYAVAATCLAVAVGLAVQQPPVDRQLILVPAATPRGQAVPRPAATVVGQPVSGAGEIVASRDRSVTESAAPIDWYADPAAPVEDAGAPPAHDHLTVSERAASGEEGVSVATRGDDATSDGEKQKDGRGSAGPGHSTGGKGDHARPAGAQRGNSATHAQDGAKRHVAQLEKSGDGKRPKRPKSTKDH
jgi:hypothetical protein